MAAETRERDRRKCSRGEGQGGGDDRQGMKKQSGGYAGSRGRAPMYRQPS